MGRSHAAAVEVKFQPVAEGVYAHIGDMGPRTAANGGLNASIALVVTPAGAVLIDSGVTLERARQIHAAVWRVTDLPGTRVRVVGLKPTA